MTNEELVKALRWCSVDEYVPCEGCPMDEETHGTGCFNIMHQRAAAAIEELLESVGMLGEQRSYWIDKAAEYYNQLPKRGEWIFVPGDGKTCCDGWECSICGKTYHTNVPYFGEFNYCPNCGAKMEVQE